MVLSQVEPLFSLGDSAQVDRVLVALKAHFGLIQERDGQVDVCVLARGEDGQKGVFDGVELMGESLNERVVQGEQIGVLALVECLLFEVTNQLVTDLMPQLFLVLERNGSDAVIELRVADGMIFEHGQCALSNHLFFCVFDFFG